MPDALVTYLQDHLAGAKFAIKLLEDLSEQPADERVAKLARMLLVEVEADRNDLQRLAERIGGESNAMKEAAAWVAQKFGGLKLSLGDPIGRFEAIETLALGVLGKLSLWDALATIRQTDGRLGELDLDKLALRARTQYQQLEELRLAMAPSALAQTSV